MLICPQCRHDNPEEGRFCVNCGRSLAPEDMRLSRPTEREDKEQDDLDVPPAVRRSPIPVILAIVLAGVVVSAFFMFQSTAPDPCRGKFASPLHPYCVQIPAGWQGNPELVGEGNIDLFSPTRANAQVQVAVRSAPVEATTSSLGYAQIFRSDQETRGGVPGPYQLVPVGGEDAIAWDLTADTTTGSTRERWVVVTREGRGWWIRLVASGTEYETARLNFERMLQSWTWT